jgi:plastocyanin
MTFSIRSRQVTDFIPAGILLPILMVCGSACNAASVSVQVVDASGQPVADAAVYVEAASGPALPKPQKTVEIEQKGRKFLPPVSVIQVGTSISFPNNDTVRHHVYSFSSAKVFDLKLYSGQPENPVNFDKPGTVVIGCNIHDQMVAYIHVVPTPYFAKTDASGSAKIDGVAAGKYRLKAWHFGMQPSAAIPEQPLSVASSDSMATITVNTKAK